MKHLHSCSMGTAAQRKTFISKRLKRAILVLPLKGMHWVLLEASGVLERKAKMHVCFRATGTKAAPGKERN